MQFELESTFASQQQQQQQQSDSKYRSSFFSKGSVIKRWFKEAKKKGTATNQLKNGPISALFEEYGSWLDCFTNYIFSDCV